MCWCSDSRRLHEGGRLQDGGAVPFRSPLLTHLCSSRLHSVFINISELKNLAVQGFQTSSNYQVFCEKILTIDSLQMLSSTV